MLIPINVFLTSQGDQIVCYCHDWPHRFGMRTANFFIQPMILEVFLILWKFLKQVDIGNIIILSVLVVSRGTHWIQSIVVVGKWVENDPPPFPQLWDQLLELPIKNKKILVNFLNFGVDWQPHIVNLMHNLLGQILEIPVHSLFFSLYHFPHVPHIIILILQQVEQFRRKQVTFSHFGVYRVHS